MKTILWFDEIGKNDIAKVGGKGANLGEMLSAGIPVPYGFVVTAGAYFDFLQKAKLVPVIKNHLKLLDHKDSRSLSQTAGYIQKAILKARMPEEIAREIMLSYYALRQKGKKASRVFSRLSSF